MYAIIKTGGKQYKVQAGDVLQVEKLENALGSELTIEDILMVGGDKTHVGTPTVKNAKVTAVITKQARTMKVFVFKKKRRQGYRKFGTHKQNFTEIFIQSITSPDGQTVRADTKAEVKDIAAIRLARFEQKTADSRARAEAMIGTGSAKKTESTSEKIIKKAKKSVAKAPVKKAAAKKTAVKKAPSKRSVKKATKTVAKKKK
jgi:large subunit ribosomal protein L21